MRFNSRELTFLAQQPPERFDKEGILRVKEKQEGIFRKGEVYVERLFRLRGNLLFYFKTKDRQSEPIGVMVLERCAVQLDPDEDLAFILVFDGDEKIQQLTAATERERDSWIESLHIASYECMKMQLQSLREQLRSKTGKDPIDNPDPSMLPEFKPGECLEQGEPFLEMCLSCDDLPQEGRPPNSFISVSVATPPSQQWTAHAHTEIIERNFNPSFMTTVGFSDRTRINLNTKVRVIVYDVKERMTSTMTQIGVAIFTMSDLLTAPGSRLRLRLNSTDFNDPGNVVVMAWQNDPEFMAESLNGVSESDGNLDNEFLNGPATAAMMSGQGGKTRQMEMLRPLYSNIITKTYRLPTNLGKELSVHEYMGESKLTYNLPIQLLKLWVEEEKKKIEQLQELGELTQPHYNTQQELMDFHMSSISMYTQTTRYLSGYKGPPFKPSCKKGHKEVEFAPTNLHIQRMCVQNNAKNTSACYDVTTVGAFTAYAQKYRHGGLRRLLKQMKGNCSESVEGQNKIERINAILNNANTLRQSIHKYCDGVCRAAVQGESAELSNLMSVLSDKTRQLIQVCENPLVENGITRYEEAKFMDDGGMHGPNPAPQQDPGGYLQAPETRLNDSSPEKTWKWSGTDFVKSPTLEPWELTRLNSEASIVCVQSKIEEMLKLQGSDAGLTNWLEVISPLIIKLKSCIEVMCKRAEASLTMLSLVECSNNVALMHTIKYRRDVVFSQALTAAVSAFMTKLRGSMTDEAFLRQISQIGVLLEFESVLSCHGDEIGMLEDMVIGVDDLAHVVFKVTQASRMDEIMPVVKGNSLLRDGMFPDFNRTGYTVEIPVPQSMFSLLPDEIQRGRNIKIVPVLFSIGFNEQATLAERFGDTSIQEGINVDGFQRLSTYQEKYSEIIGESEHNGKNMMPLDQMMRHLHINVMSKKNKNVEMLHLASEVCRKLNGIRFTQCKSAKDRTAMAVTLEQVQLLQREHDLASHSFMHTLECMRCEGVRRENTLKNTGSRKYAFNSLQLLSMPKLYRPPNGTFGNIQT